MSKAAAFGLHTKEPSQRALKRVLLMLAGR